MIEKMSFRAPEPCALVCARVRPCVRPCVLSPLVDAPLGRCIGWKRMCVRVQSTTACSNKHAHSGACWTRGCTCVFMYTGQETEGMWRCSCISHFDSELQGITSFTALLPAHPLFPAPWKGALLSKSSHGPGQRAQDSKPRELVCGPSSATVSLPTLSHSSPLSEPQLLHLGNGVLTRQVSTQNLGFQIPGPLIPLPLPYTPCSCPPLPTGTP